MGSQGNVLCGKTVTVGIDSPRPAGQKYVGETGMGERLRVQSLWVKSLWTKSVWVKGCG